MGLTGDIVAAHASHNNLAIDHVPELIVRVFDALSGLGAPALETAPPIPAVPVRASAKSDHVICLECGKRMKVLKRHLAVRHGLTADEYRRRWGLSAVHPLAVLADRVQGGALAKRKDPDRQKSGKHEDPQGIPAEIPGEKKRVKLALWRGGAGDGALGPLTHAASSDLETEVQMPSEPEVSNEKILLEAIARLRVIVADYNGAQMRLAPHQLFSRHGDLFVSALNTGKNWRSADERRLGHFKVGGLSRIALTEDAFEPLPGFDGGLPREGDVPLFAVGIAEN